MSARIAAVSSVAVVMLIAGLTPVRASGGISCEAHDSAIKLDVMADVARAIGAKVISPQRDLEIKDRAASWQTIAIKDGLVQSWIEGRDAKLQFYVENTALNGGDSVELVISTSRHRDSGGFKGGYVLRVYGQGADAKVLTQHGKAACSLD